MLRGGENDCEVGMLFPSFFEGGVSAKPTGWLVWTYTHTTPGLRPTPPRERRGKRLRSRDALPLLFSRRGKRLRGRDAERRGKRLRGRDALPPLFSRRGNDCEVGMLFPSFLKEGKRLRGRDALPLLFSRRGVGEADGVVGVDLHLAPTAMSSIYMRTSMSLLQPRLGELDVQLLHRVARLQLGGFDIQVRGLIEVTLAEQQQTVGKLDARDG